jgi:hypothetical protein
MILSESLCVFRIRLYMYSLNSQLSNSQLFALYSVKSQLCTLYSVKSQHLDMAQGRNVEYICVNTFTSKQTSQAGGSEPIKREREKVVSII